MALLDDLLEVMTDGSLCAMGGLTPVPVLQRAARISPKTFRAAPIRERRNDRVATAGIRDRRQNHPHGADPRTRHRHADPGLRRTSSTLTIDGSDVSVPRGTSVMAAAALMGTAIPKLCATDSLEPFGSCRLCLVEIEGRRGTPASCTTVAEPGMVVRTQTPKLAKLRRGVMELYISDHPLTCLTCSANGDCELQDMAGAVGPARGALRRRRARTIATLRPTRRTPISPSNPRSASSATAASAPARRCRAPSR